MLDTRCWILDAGYSILDSRCWILDAGYSILDSRCGDEGSGERGAGRGTKEAAGEKEEIHIIKPSFCAERLWPAVVSGDYFVNLAFTA